MWKKDREVRIGVRPITARLLETFDSTALGPAWLGVKLEAAVLIGLNEAVVPHREVGERDCHFGA